MISLIDAGPGSGKTFTIAKGACIVSKEFGGIYTPTKEQEEIFAFLKEELPSTKSVVMFAFANSAKQNLENRFNKWSPKIYTFHGAGASCIIKKYGFQPRDLKRSDKIIEGIIGEELDSLPPTTKREWVACKRLVHYLKVESLPATEESLSYLLIKYPDLSSYSIPEWWEEQTKEVLKRAAFLHRREGIDYDDMVWLGKKALASPRFDIGFVDEAQDISNSAYQLVTRMCRHVIFCGDVNQAINAFAGGSEEMYNKVKTKSDAVLSLKMTLRCPPSICALANTIRPRGIIEGPNKLDGEIETIHYTALVDQLKKCDYRDTLILGRTNATIIGTALFLSNKGVDCFVQDTDLHKQLTAFIQTFKCDYVNLPKQLEAYDRRMSYSKNEMWVQMCLSLSETVRKLHKVCSSYATLYVLVEALFKPKKGYMLTTLHKGKGLEAENVFLLNPPLELPQAMRHPIAKEQEINLVFVGITRSSKNLYWVEGTK